MKDGIFRSQGNEKGYNVDDARLFEQMLDLVEKSVQVNTQLLDAQLQTKKILEEQVVPSLSCVRIEDHELLIKTCKEFQLLCYDSNYQLMDIVRDLRESGFVKKIKNYFVAGAVIVSVIGLIGIFKGCEDIPSIKIVHPNPISKGVGP